METTFIRTLNSNDNCENFCYYLVFGFMVFLMSHSWLCAGGVWETIWGARDLKLRTVQCKHLTHQTLVLFLNPFTEMENTIRQSWDMNKRAYERDGEVEILYTDLY